MNMPPPEQVPYYVSIAGLDVRILPDTYSPIMIEALTNGDYEGRERYVTENVLRTGDRILEVGTAVGVVAMSAAKLVGAENVLTFDANPYISADALHNFARNGLSGITAKVGILRSKSDWLINNSPVTFYVCRDFWGSRLDGPAGHPDFQETVCAEVFCLEKEIAEHGANVLICDIEGGEVRLLEDADLSGIRLIIMEVHYDNVGESAIDHLIRGLHDKNFVIDLRWTGDSTVVLRRM